MASTIITHALTFVAGLLIGIKTHDNIDISAGKVDVLKGEVDNVEVKITEESEIASKPTT